MNDAEEEKRRESKIEVLTWGYLPGLSAHSSLKTTPECVSFPEAQLAGDSWRDICGGGCGYGMAISVWGKVITWGSSDDQSRSFLSSGKQETPELFLLPNNDPIMKAAAGWGHCVSVTDNGEVYTWGWKECIPLGKITNSWKNSEHKNLSTENSTIINQGNHSPDGSRSTDGSDSSPNEKNYGNESIKRRKIVAQQESETLLPAYKPFSEQPCLVNLDPGVKIASVAAGGRHTLALSDAGQVWGWGYGGEGQLGLGTRAKMVAIPHLIPCFDGKNWPDEAGHESIYRNSQPYKSIGNYIKGIACGGRHSAVVTDTGVLLTFGWGSYGQCGHGNTDDHLRPTSVSSLLGTKIEAVAAGLWHTLCICTNGRIYVFGGNQFGQLGLGIASERLQIVPKIVHAGVLENEKAKTVSSGARHCSVLTETGKIFSWGWNKYGQLGLGDVVDRNIPSQVPLLEYTPIDVACGWWHTLALCKARPDPGLLVRK